MTTVLTSPQLAPPNDDPSPATRPISLDPLQLQLQAELLDVQESLDTLVFLMRHSNAHSASLIGLAALLDAMSSQVADVSLQLAA